MSAVLTADLASNKSERFPAAPENRNTPDDVVPQLLPSRAVYGRHTSWSTIALIALMHVLVVIALLQMDSIRERLTLATPLKVSLLTENKVQPEVEPVPKKLMMISKVPTPSILPPVIEVLVPQQQIQPTISVAESRQLTAPDPKPGPAKPPEIVPPNFIAAYLDNPAPAYPPAAKRMHEQGTVILRVLVTPEGRVDKVEVQTSSGSSRLDTAAQATVQKWRFVPAKQGAQAVISWVLVPIDFQLT